MSTKSAYGRYKGDKPRSKLAPPIQIVFGHFLDDDVQASGPIPDDAIRHTLDYMKAASTIYTSEDDRRAELTPLNNILGVDIQITWNANDKDKFRWSRGIGIRVWAQLWAHSASPSNGKKNMKMNSEMVFRTHRRNRGLSVSRYWAQKPLNP